MYFFLKCICHSLFFIYITYKHVDVLVFPRFLECILTLTTNGTHLWPETEGLAPGFPLLPMVYVSYRKNTEFLQVLVDSIFILSSTFTLLIIFKSTFRLKHMQNKCLEVRCNFKMVDYCNNCRKWSLKICCISNSISKIQTFIYILVLFTRQLWLYYSLSN